MGGPGSGRWRLHVKKLTVESCLALDMSKLVRDGLIVRGDVAGPLWWTDTRTGEVTASLRYMLAPTPDTEDRMTMTLQYAVTSRGEKQEVSETVPLVTTRPRFGGLRWWFQCPLTGDGVYCGRRVGKLYLPPGATYFGCRHCYDLTYRSAQEHDKRVDLLRKHLRLLELCRNVKARG